MSHILDRRGHVALTFALFIGPLIVIVFGAVQFSFAVSTRNKLQNHVDQMALNAARFFIDHDSVKPVHISKIIGSWVAEETKKIAASVDSISALEIVPVIDIDSRTVELRATGFYEPEWAGALAHGDGKFEQISKAKAVLETRPICILGTITTQIVGMDFANSAEITATDCVVWTNSVGLQAIKFSGRGRVATERLCSAGRATPLGNFEAFPWPENECDPIPDPLAQRKISAPRNLPCIAFETRGDFTDGAYDSVRFMPGRLCQPITLSGRNIIFDPGVYVLAYDFLIQTSNQLVGDDVIFVIADETGHSYVEFSGPGSIALKGPTSGHYAGLLFASARVGSGVKSFRINGNTETALGGVTYLPDYDINFTNGVNVSAASPVTTIIGKTVAVRNNSFLEVANDPDLAPYAPRIEVRNGWVRLIR